MPYMYMRGYVQRSMAAYIIKHRAVTLPSRYNGPGRWQMFLLRYPERMPVHTDENLVIQALAESQRSHWPVIIHAPRAE